MSERKLVRIQEKGQVTLPADIRRKLGLKKGDLVAIIETDEGALITPQEVIATKALDRIGQILKEKGLTLEELIESGREERGHLIEERYGIPADEQDD
ncbi:MAG: AbrB/MazE/SpoVT family DNA-binding domain-containing protein [Chloroflexi bacterium]|nr:AbrB/MazE/SpoVT family DNA-binding domain-containing protein [Chloroflexota bacterium]